MRALFTTTGHASHPLPLAPFARACQHTGREVALATTRSRGHAVKRLGLTVRPFNEADSAAWAPVPAELAMNTVGEYGATTHASVAESHAVRGAQSP